MSIFTHVQVQNVPVQVCMEINSHNNMTKGCMDKINCDLSAVNYFSLGCIVPFMGLTTS